MANEDGRAPQVGEGATLMAVETCPRDCPPDMSLPGGRLRFFLLALDRLDARADAALHLALVFGALGRCPALEEGAAGLALDALDRRVRDVVLLAQDVCHLLDGEAARLPRDAVDRA